MVLFTFFFTIFVLPEVVSAQEENDWWNSQEIMAKGYGINNNIKDISETNQNELRERAIADARRNLANKIVGLRIKADEIINEELASSIAALAVVKKERVDANGSMVVNLGISIYGNENSLSQLIFKSHIKKNLPLPTKNNGKIQGNYTALIIDCTEWEDTHKFVLNPVIMPIIKDNSDRIIYGYEYLDYDVAVKNGIVQYAPDLNHSEYGLAVGNNPLIVKVTSIVNDSGDLVISVKDADKILLENGITHFLDKAAVIIVSNRIDISVEDNRGGRSWGVRDSDVFS